MSQSIQLINGYLPWNSMIPKLSKHVNPSSILTIPPTQLIMLAKLYWAFKMCWALFWEYYMNYLIFPAQKHQKLTIISNFYRWGTWDIERLNSGSYTRRWERWELNLSNVTLNLASFLVHYYPGDSDTHGLKHIELRINIGLWLKLSKVLWRITAINSTFPLSLKSPSK